MPYKDPEVRKTYDTQKVIRRKERGLCSRCGKRPPIKNHVSCQECVDKAEASRQEIKEQGICTSCRKEPVVEGRIYCSSCLERSRWLSLNRRNKNPLTKFEHNKNAAIKIGREWHLSFEQFKSLIESDCAYCGQSPNGWLNGVDRVDNNKEYVIGNCVSCCKMCNYMKSTFSRERFLAQVEKIYTYQKQKVK